MPPIDRDALLDQMQALAQHHPPASASIQAIQATRAAILRAQFTRQQQRRRLMRITLTTGIAACLLAAAGLLWMTRIDRAASAAEQLQQAVEAGSAYKGWIHWTDNSSGLTPPPPGIGAADAATATRRAYLPSLPGVAWRVTHHTNTVDGTDAVVLDYAEGLDITVYFPAKGESASYSFKSNEIRLRSMHNEQVKSIRSQDMPTTIGEILAKCKATLGRDPFSVKETPVGDLKRYDVTLFSSDAQAESFQKEHPDFMGRALVIWVNRDKLMTRIKFDDQQDAMVFDYTYGPPEIHDIYDLGAPRTAKVVDERLKNDLKGLMTRLDTRALKGYGDYVALLVTYDLDAAGQVALDYGFVTLFANKGEKWLANEYRLVPSSRPRPEDVLTEVPPNWPAPDIAKLLPALFVGKPTQYFIMDGDHGWAGWYHDGPLPYPDARPIAAQERNIRLYDMALAGQIWPTSIKTGIGFPGTTADIFQDPAHPGLVGLHYKHIPNILNGEISTGETTWWLNPARDDVPIEITSSSTDQDQPKPDIVTHTHYDEFAQLPNGQWYPARWHEDRTDRNARTGMVTASNNYYRLQILPTLKLDDAWFTDPRPRLTTAPSSIP